MVQRPLRDDAHDEPRPFHSRPREGTRLDQIMAELKARQTHYSAAERPPQPNITPLNTPFRAEMQTLQASIDQLANKVDGQRLSDAIAELTARVEALHTDRSLGEPEMRLLRSIRRSLDDLIYHMNVVSAEPEPAPRTPAPSAPSLAEPVPVFGRRAAPPEPQKAHAPEPVAPQAAAAAERLTQAARRADVFRPVAARARRRWPSSDLIRRYPLASVAAAACFAIALAQGVNEIVPRVGDITGSISSGPGSQRAKPQAQVPRTDLTPVPTETATLAAPRLDPTPLPANPPPAPVPMQAAPVAAPAPLPLPTPASRAADDPAGMAAYQAGVRLAEGPTRDYRAAVQMFEKAGDIPAAQFRLALLYERGQGTPKNLAMARTLYQKAAERGNVRAMHNLGVLYADGVDGRPDYALAAEWFRRAAVYGLRVSMYKLATLTARGHGVE